MISFRVDKEEKVMVETLSKWIARSQSDTIRLAIERLNLEATSIPREEAVMIGRQE